MGDRKWVITIDGPAGSGKSTVAKRLARQLNFLYLDTGALYRAVAYKIQAAGIAEPKTAVLRALFAQTKISLRKNHEGLAVFVDQEDVSQKIRTEEIAVLASTVSAIPLVREALLPIQRECGKNTGVVAEGRDMGTVVFPRADFKFYLHATPEERAQRRFLEFREKGLSPVYEEIRASIVLRDKQDTERDVSPLRVPEDARVIDTSEMTIPEVMEEILGVLGE
jgi:cytidylate kinase